MTEASLPLDALAFAAAAVVDRPDAYLLPEVEVDFHVGREGGTGWTVRLGVVDVIEVGRYPLAGAS